MSADLAGDILRDGAVQAGVVSGERTSQELRFFCPPRRDDGRCDSDADDFFFFPLADPFPLEAGPFDLRSGSDLAAESLDRRFRFPAEDARFTPVSAFRAALALAFFFASGLSGS